MSKDYTAYLLHILDAINIIESYIAGLTEDSFRQNRLIQDGVIRNLEIVGEATKKLPKRLRNKYPDIEWKKMAGMRDCALFPLTPRPSTLIPCPYFLPLEP